MEYLISLLNISKVALGLGFVIFLHELGHFLLAKWNGVKVEKFSIGFGPTLLGFTKGETEYVLAAVPLGGFVKMLGEGPDEEASKSSDPRAYPNKTVGARMAIISAGVIMNLILGVACFVYAYGQGMDEVPTTIGAVMAGAPAYEAGMRPGDEIVAIDGREDLTFTNVTLKVRLSSQGQVIHFEMARPGHDGRIKLDLEPRREASAEHPGIGIYPSESLTLSAAPYSAPAGVEVRENIPVPVFKPKDEVVSIIPPEGEPIPVKDNFDWRRLISRYRDKTITVVVNRLVDPNDLSASAKREQVKVVVPPSHFVDFGFRLTGEPIAAVRKDSPAEKAGFRKGDLILKVDGRADFDPMRLPTECYDKAGKPMTFEVERAESGGTKKTITLTVTPDDTPPWTEIAFPNEPLDVPGLGIAYHVRTKIAAVVPSSPAEKAGLKAGDVITALSLPEFPDAVAKRSGGLFSWIGSMMGGGKPKPPSVEFEEDSHAWPTTFQRLQSLPRGEVGITVNQSNRPVQLTPVADPTWYHPNRGEQFEILNKRMPPQDMVGSMKRGLQDTVDNILSIYAMFRSLGQGRVSPKNLGGPIMIASVAYSAARSSLTDLVHFLGILSINLAVLNFLPIPPLDGGQMVFLLAEKVRGRPLPDSALIAGTYLGLLLVLGLMAFVMFMDVTRYL
ncbi:MAG: site-2 protease family protein [Isosphaeraceae bacterium]